MNTNDFNILKSGIVYLDSAATSLKPTIVVDSISDYYNNFSSNIHRGNYSISIKAENLYEETRSNVAKLINANTNEIIFTSGTTDSLNKVVFGYLKNYLNNNDEVLISKAEHASLVLPLFKLKKEKNININYIPLDNNYSINLDNVIKSITPNTKVIMLAQISNVIGDIRPIKEIVEYAHKNNIIVIIDAAQSVPHMKVDVKEIDCDFLAFSSHKMLGPTGVGVLYGKYNLLEDMEPTTLGGGMNAIFNFDYTYELNNIPTRFEAGTPNIAGVIGFNSAIKYINNIGINNIYNHEVELKDYLVSKLEQNNNIIMYNKDTKSGILTFNYKDIFSEDLAVYLSKYNVCVRSGNHCTKLLKDELGIKNTVRVSLYLYNTKKDIDILVDLLNNPNIKNEII